MEGIEPQSGENGKPPVRERRRAVRQKVHIPAYASFNEGALAVDLSEILDISESGVAIQTGSPLQVDHTLDLCLDLSETGSRIQATAEIVWTDPAGRAGIHLPELSEDSRQQLQQWLLHNAVAGCQDPEPGKDDAVLASPELVDSPPPDYTAILAALGAVAREVESLGSDLDPALLLIAERARAFTRATGVAIAFCDGDELVCHAATGPDAPPAGVRFPTGSGFSGECVRTGRLLRCDDSESDARVDREVCRTLGIRSMAAVPIRLGGKVIGILEVFSNLPKVFGANDDMVLQRLAETIFAAVNRAARAHVSSRNQAAPFASASSEGPPEPVSGAAADAAPRMPLYQKILMIAVGATILLVLIFVLTPWLRSQSGVRHGVTTSQASTRTNQPSTPAAPKAVAGGSTVDNLRRLAEQGDPYAQFAVGARYATGEDVKQDYAVAVTWFTKAAEQGHVVAQATLGAYYWAGRGIPQDLSKAYFWSILARAGGDEASKYRVAVLTSRMTRAQVATAQQQADDWIGHHQLAKQSSPR